jgi:hypothetical protein
MLVPDFDELEALPVPAEPLPLDGMLVPALGEVVLEPDFAALPVFPELEPPDADEPDVDEPGDVVAPGCVDDPVEGWVADGAGCVVDEPLPDPVDGGLPLPELWAKAGAIIAATIAPVVRRLIHRGAMSRFLLAGDGARRSAVTVDSRSSAKAVMRIRASGGANDLPCRETPRNRRARATMP